MKQRRALLFPALPALLTADEEARVRVCDFSRHQVLAADGVLGEELLRTIDGAAPGARLAVLDPLGALALRLQRAERVPLTPLAALRRQGFDTLFLELTLECTERCIHCYADAGPHRRERLERSTCLEILEDAAALGFRCVQFTGGDPLTCTFFGELLTRGRELGFEVREVFTNGLLLSEARLAALAPLEPSFAFSLYSAEPGIHDSITGVAGSHRRTCEAIARACAKGLEVRVAVVVMEQNAAGVEETFALARSLGAAQVEASGSHSVGRGHYVEEAPGARAEGGSDRGEDSGRHDAGERGRTEVAGEFDGDQSSCLHDTGEQLGTLCVAGDGAVYPCVFNRTDYLGSVLARPLRDIVARPDPIPEAGDPARFLSQVGRRLQCVGCQCTAVALRSC